ncbi:MAG: multiheme c-type cytochrome [Bdellovibrionota bacterium]
MLFALSQIEASRRDQELAKADLIAKVYGHLGLDAYVPGRRDLAAGWAKLEQLAKLTGAPFLAANLESLGPQTQFLKKHTLLQRKGWKVGLFGVVSPEDFSGVAGVAPRDPIKVAREQVSALKRAGANLIVALSYLGLDSDRRLAAVPGINLIFGSRSLDVLTQPQLVGKTLIFQSDVEGRQIGVLEYDPKTPLQSPHGLIELDKSWEAKNIVSGWMAAHKEYVRQLAFSVHHNKERSKNAFVAQPFVCRQCHQAQYDFWEKTNHASAYLVLFSKNQHFNPECIGCHSLGFQTPEGFSKIAEPFELKDSKELKGKKVFAEQLMEAVFGKEKGPLDSRVDPKRYQRLHDRYTRTLRELNEAQKLEKVYVGVQCEHCHGNRHGHPAVKVAPTRVSEASCLKCHVGSHDPKFNFAEKLPKIACPRMR